MQLFSKLLVRVTLPTESSKVKTKNSLLSHHSRNDNDKKG